MKVLIYDPTSCGHNPSWWYCAARACLDAGHELVLAGPESCEAVDFWESKLKGERYERLYTRSQPKVPNLFEALRMAELHCCDRLVLPYFDFVLSELRRIKAKLYISKPFYLCGIFFRPPNLKPERLRPLDYVLALFIISERGKEKRRVMRRKHRNWKANRKLENLSSSSEGIRLISLDSDRNESLLRAHFPFAVTNRLKCDPWLTRSRLNKLQAREKLRLPEDTFIFLHCGSAAREKGLADGIEAWDLLPRELKERSLVLRAGLMDDEALSQKYRAKGMLKEGFINQETLDDLYAACDCVLMPYRNHTGSSGVLVHAAAAGRPVVAPDYAVVGDYVKRHDLGYTFEHLNLQSLSDAMARAIEGDYVQSGAAKSFVEKNSKDRFVEELKSHFFEE
jgi:glycosyltransferase involved in cell wall biosynthesis